MKKHYPDRTDSHDACMRDVVVLFDLKRSRPVHPSKRRCENKPQSPDHVVHGSSEDRYCYQSQKDAREAHDAVVDEHDGLVGKTAEVSRRKARQGSQDESYRYSGHGNEYGKFGGAHYPRQDIPAEVIRSERMRGGRRQKFGGRVRGVRIVRRPEQ